MIHYEIEKVLGISILVTVAFVAGFSAIEPKLLNAIEDQFTVTQTVTAEISFATPASDITMDGSIAGITGGTANGQTQVAVSTNNSTGYTMSIISSSTPAMQGNTQGGYINDYTVSTTTGMEPDYTFSVGVNTAEFGYTVSASTTSDLDQSFKDDGIGCNTGSSDTSGSSSCWMSPSSTAYTIINRSSSTAVSGATSTIYFRVQITANPSPSVPEDTYTATTTLTATTN